MRLQWFRPSIPLTYRRMRRSAFWLSLLGFVQFITAPLLAVEPVVLTDEIEKVELGLHLEILEDKTGKLTYEDVTSAAYADFLYCV